VKQRSFLLVVANKPHQDRLMRQTRCAFSLALLLSAVSPALHAPQADAQWTQIGPTVTPDARDGAVVLYDPVHKEMVLFGGETTDTSNETWLLKGDVWTQRAPAHSPEPRVDSYGFWDTKRERMVVFGGNAPGQIDRSVIWSWDGNDWSSFTPTANPPARRDAAVTYDSARDRIVLFGGAVDGSPDKTLADTWEFDGNTWLETTPGVSPGDRGAALLGYDPVRQIIVLVNGYSEATGTLRKDTWIYRDGAWTEAPSASAPQGSSLELIWHPTLQKLLIVGRKETGSLCSWTFDGAVWKEHATSAYSLNGIPKASLTFDSERGVAVYLREEGQSYRGYRLSGTSWEQFLPVPQPGAADVARGALIFDTAANEPRLFGDAGGNYQGWRWDGTMWRLMALEAQSPSATARVAYDVDREVAVAYDGRTVELAGTVWAGKAAATAPASSGAMAHDLGRGRIVYFGGSVAFAQYSDATWSWNGASWEQLLLPTAPTARRQAAMAYDTRRGRMVLFGGMGTLNSQQRRLVDTWELNDVTWTQSAAQVPFELRGDPSMTYDQGRRRVVLWGAQREDESKVWEYNGTTWVGTEPPPIAGITGIVGYDTAGQRLLLHDGNGHTWARPSGSTPDGSGGAAPAGTGTDAGSADHGNSDVDGAASDQDAGKSPRRGGDSGCSAAPSSSSQGGIWLWLTAIALVYMRRRSNLAASD
jgi:hypothetical protein